MGGAGHPPPKMQQAILTSPSEASSISTAGLAPIETTVHYTAAGAAAAALEGGHKRLRENDSEPDADKRPCTLPTNAFLKRLPNALVEAIVRDMARPVGSQSGGDSSAAAAVALALWNDHDDDDGDDDGARDCDGEDNASDIEEGDYGDESNAYDIELGKHGEHDGRADDKRSRTSPSVVLEQPTNSPASDAPSPSSSPLSSISCPTLPTGTPSTIVAANVDISEQHDGASSALHYFDFVQNDGNVFPLSCSWPAPPGPAGVCGDDGGVIVAVAQGG